MVALQAAATVPKPACVTEWRVLSVESSGLLVDIVGWPHTLISFLFQNTYKMRIKEIMKYDASSLFFFLRIALAIWCLLWFLMNIRIIFLFLWKKLLEFWQRLYWICRLPSVDGHFHNFNSSNPWTWDIVPFICVFFTCFYQCLIVFSV